MIHSIMSLYFDNATLLIIKTFLDRIIHTERVWRLETCSQDISHILLQYCTSTWYWISIISSLLLDYRSQVRKYFTFHASLAKKTWLISSLAVGPYFFRTSISSYFPPIVVQICMKSIFFFAIKSYCVNSSTTGIAQYV